MEPSPGAPTSESDPYGRQGCSVTAVRYRSRERQFGRHTITVTFISDRPRSFVFLVGVAVIVGTAVLSAGCGSPAKEAPPSSAVLPSPAEKGLRGVPPQAFNPNMNAADAIVALQSEGYNVVVQTGSGDPGHRNPLSQCRVAGVDGMRGDTPPANTTVYLTVAC